MQKTTPLLPGLHLQTLRRRPRSAQEKLAAEIALVRNKTFSQLGEMFGAFLPDELLSPSEKGDHSRRRVFSKQNTFWAFMGQVFSEDGSCQEVVHKLQAYASLKALPMPSSSTASYCAARKKLSESALMKVFAHTAKGLNGSADIVPELGRRVIVADGTGFSMPDTESNQKQWPQNKQQKPGCGFPSGRLTGCFSLQTGALLSYEMSDKHQHELRRFRKQWKLFRRGDILLGDSAYSSFYDMSMLRARGVDSVATLARVKPISHTNAKEVLGEDDFLFQRKKPKKKSPAIEKDEWDQVPEHLDLRQIKINVEHPGFRSKTIYLITTLLCPEKYPADMLRDLYFRRWDVELFFRDIKSTLGLDVLRCKSPAMIRKELLMYFISYNCIRRLMNEAAETAKIPVRQVSFKASVQALRCWEPHLNRSRIVSKEKNRLIAMLHQSITRKPILNRPGRSEPRAIKRRPRNFQRLTKHRHEMIVCPHRNNYRKKHAGTP